MSLDHLAQFSDQQDDARSHQKNLLIQSWPNVGPPSLPLNQHWVSWLSVSFTYWVNVLCLLREYYICLRRCLDVDEVTPVDFPIRFTHQINDFQHGRAIMTPWSEKTHNCVLTL